MTKHKMTDTLCYIPYCDTCNKQGDVNKIRHNKLSTFFKENLKYFSGKSAKLKKHYYYVCNI